MSFKFRASEKLVRASKFFKTCEFLKTCRTLTHRPGGDASFFKSYLFCLVSDTDSLGHTNLICWFSDFFRKNMKRAGEKKIKIKSFSDGNPGVEIGPGSHTISQTKDKLCIIAAYFILLFSYLMKILKFVIYPAF